MSSLSKSEGEGEVGDQSVPKWERELKAGLKREKKPWMVPRRKGFAGWGRICEPGWENFGSKKGPRVLPWRQKIISAFWVEMPSLESEACQSCMKTEVESNRSLLSVSTPQTLGRVVGPAWGWNLIPPCQNPTSSPFWTSAPMSGA